MKRAIAPVALLTILALAGCTAEAPAPAPTPSASAPAVNPESADEAVVPLALEAITPEAVTAESTRLSDAVGTYVDPALVVGVDDQSQLTAADGNAASYYASFRTYTLTADTAPAPIGVTLTNVLEASGWTIYETANQDGIFIAVLTIEVGGAAWFGIVQADETVAGSPSVAFQLASPDLPSDEG